MSVFVAWMPDEDTQAALLDLQAVLRDALPADAPRHKWRSPQQLHMTLRYLGEYAAVDPGRIDALQSWLARLCASSPRIAIALDRSEYWARVLVARPHENPALPRLFADVDAAARGCGFATEPRPATPHITLAYTDGRIPRSPARIGGDAAQAPLTLGHVSLVENPGEGGYRIRAWWPLQEPAPAAAP